MTRISSAAVLLWAALPAVTVAQEDRIPVIDVHMHAPLSPGPVESSMPALARRLAVMDSFNVRVAVVNGVPDLVYAWHEAAPDRLIPAILFPCDEGRTPNGGRVCFEDGAEFPDIDMLREGIASGRIAAFGELIQQYLGLDPTDSRLAPYWQLAEDEDIPVFVHMGPGPPGVAYEDGPGRQAPRYRSAAGNPYLLEEVLIRHPNLRVAVMHAGWPLIDEMILMLHQHPRLYVDMGVLQLRVWFSRAEYYRTLRRLVEAGFTDRIMFGSDAGVGDVIEAVMQADFLTEQQQRDILCNNAARFLRLGEGVCR